MRQIERGALLRVPAELLSDPEKLLKSLTFPNPEYKEAQMFGKRRSKGGHVITRIPKDLKFYKLDKKDRSVLIPRNYDGQVFKSTAEVIDTTTNGKVLGQWSNPSFKLRDYQERFIENSFLPAIDAGETDLLFLAQCGSGKTVTGLYAAGLLKRRTLVLVTTNTIAKQWTQTITDVYKGWTTNKLSSSSPNTDVDVLVATYSLISDERFDAEFFEQFGTVICDEYHRTGANSYNECLKKAHCRNRITLTATFRRKDNLHKVLRMHIGSVIEMESDMMKARIFPVSTRHTINLADFQAVKAAPALKDLLLYMNVAVLSKSSGKEEVRGMVTEINIGAKYVEVEGTKYDTKHFGFHKLGDISFANVETAISVDKSRIAEILRLIFWGNKRGRKILLLSNRKSLLYTLYRILAVRKMSVGVLVSDKGKEQHNFCRALGVPVKDYEALVKSSKSIILGIDKIAKEGLDVSHLDMLIYAYAEADIEQSIGRICRNLPGKPEPIAFYLLDDSPVHKKRFYGKNGAQNMFLELEHEVEEEFPLSDLYTLDI